MVNRSDLDDERAFLLRSIEDLDRERAAGDISDVDHALLRDRYVARAAEVLRDLENADPGAAAASSGAGGPTPSAAEEPVRPGAPAPGGDHGAPRSRRRRRRRALLLGAAVALVAAVGLVVVVTATSTRLPGDTSSGSVAVSRAEQVRRMDVQGDTLESQGDAAGALRQFQQVLAIDPTQPDALAQSGWLEYEAGVQARNGAVLEHAQQLEQEAVRVAPGSYAAHLYLGSMLLAENDAVGAQEQYTRFLADHPPTAEVQAAAPFIRRAFAATRSRPPALPG
ncbi:MAG TPA: hypothetical protein VKU86_06030 [Acidimicrobiales bacterium]|nr:hypothetical protein [Acidimicrobiales bacterium]